MSGGAQGDGAMTGSCLDWGWAVVGLLTAWLLFLRLDTAFGWSMDESWYSAPALDLARNGRLRMLPWAGARHADQIALIMPPGYLVWLAGFFKVFGFSEFAARSASATLGVLAAFGLYGAMRRTTGSRLASLVAVVLMLTDPLFHALAKRARMDILVAAGGITSYWLFLCGRPTLAGLAAGAAFVAHPNGYVVGTLALLGGWILHWPRLSVVIRSVAAFLVPLGLYGLVIAGYWEAYRAQQGHMLAGGFHGISGLWSGLTREWLGRYAEYWNQYGTRPRLGVAGGFWTAGLVVAAAALLVTARERRRWVTALPVFGLLASWVVIPSSPYSWYLGVVLPFVYLWAGWLALGIGHGVLSRLPAALAGRPARAAVTLALIVTVLVQALGTLAAPPAEDPVARRAIAGLAAKVPEGSRVLGDVLFWHEFANRDVAYFIPEALSWDASGQAPEAILRRIRPAYALLERERIDPNSGEFVKWAYWRKIAELGLCLGERVGLIAVPYFGTLSLFRIDWARDPGDAWRSLVGARRTRIGALSVGDVSTHSGARAAVTREGLHFEAPRSLQDHILSWGASARGLEPGEYEVEVVGRMVRGQVNFNVNDDAVRLVLGRQPLTARVTSVTRVGFEMTSSGPIPGRLTVWNHAAAVPGGAAAEGIIQSIDVNRVTMECEAR